MILLHDTLRKGAEELVRQLILSGKEVLLSSGDRQANVVELAQHLGIDNYHAALLPEHKLALLKQLQKDGHTVLVVGDGINDVPLLAGGDISMAMGTADNLRRSAPRLKCLA